MTSTTTTDRPAASSYDAMDRMPLLSPSGVAAKPLGYQSTQDMPSSLTDAVPPGPVSEAGEGSSMDSSEDDEEGHLTSVKETFLHLVKGYIGPGMLSLPWAVSQVGIPVGFFGVFLMSYWSSYNCWTVVRVKRYIEHSRGKEQDEAADDDKVSEAGSSVTTNTNITYPDVGEWAYGKTFQSYVSGCICTQQLAICTVFVSFIGENLIAVLKALPIDWGFWESHVGVMTLALPACLSLSFIPSLKGLAPVMAAGTFLLLATLVIMGYIGGRVWHERPPYQELPSFEFARAPLALCAILYSYEGICLILPIESAMKEPKKFFPTFVASMTLVSVVLATFACCCVLAFGEVTNGSVTAFLIDHYQHGGEADLMWWLLLANTAISFSVLLTYPLQLFPAVELLGPSWSKVFGGNIVDAPEKDEEEENDLTGFDPLPPLPEHDTFAEEEEFSEEHKYGDGEEEQDENGATLTIENVVTTASDSRDDADDAQSIRSFISSAISLPNQMMPKMILPGDSPQLRAALVFLTYAIAVVVPNVQALISLAGALAGSSTALLIPPILELAWLQHLESGMTVTTAAAPKAGDAPPPSPSMRAHSKPRTSRPYKYLFAKIKCYSLLVAGFIFMCIGTYASIADIVAIYAGRGD